MHFKRLILFLGLINLALVSSKAQISIQVNSTSIGRFQTSKVFEGTIVNNGTSVSDGLVLEITLMDASSSEKFVWRSRPFSGKSGSTSFRDLNIVPQNGEFISGQEFYGSTIYLEVGEYTAEYELSGMVNGVPSTLHSIQSNIESTEFPSILLISVEHGDTLTEKYPVFNWSAFLFPQPQADGINSFDVEYSILIKEVFSNQSDLEAMEFNPTHHQFEHLRQSTYSYPFNGRPFADSAIYVWKVEARVKGAIVSNSEVWRFIYCPKPPKVTNTPIIILNPEKGTSSTTVQKNELKVGYHEKLGAAQNTLLKASILDGNGNLVTSGEELNFMAKQGFNVFSVSLCPDGLNLNNGSYKLVVYTLNGLKMELNFTYERTNECE